MNRTTSTGFNNPLKVTKVKTRLNAQTIRTANAKRRNSPERPGSTTLDKCSQSTELKANSRYRLANNVTHSARSGLILNMMPAWSFTDKSVIATLPLDLANGN
ncbi:hypothetical protein D3C72_2072370 [compost metagenome]